MCNVVQCPNAQIVPCPINGTTKVRYLVGAGAGAFPSVIISSISREGEQAGPGPQNRRPRMTEKQLRAGSPQHIHRMIHPDVPDFDRLTAVSTMLLAPVGRACT
jgi:hypothetical protein